MIKKPIQHIIVLTVLLFLLLVNGPTALAIEADSSRAEREFYLGAGLTTITYHIYYKEPQKLAEYQSGYFTPVYLNFGYHLSKRARLQLGLAYGGSKASYTWSPNPLDADPVQYEQSSRTQVFAIPVATQFVFFNAFKRFPVYGTVSIMPAFSTTKGKTRESQGGKTATREAKDSGVNVFAAAGIGFNYKISRCFNGYTEFLFYKRNLKGQNSFFYDWEQGASKSRQIFRSFALGVNYSL